jgi:hypothetical protein
MHRFVVFLRRGEIVYGVIERFDCFERCVKVAEALGEVGDLSFS